ncbi:MAG TPA: MFS transporter [Pirellulaceae bacterium]|nr:MFS transporter [Pirellulaceae bacterium]
MSEESPVSPSLPLSVPPSLLADDARPDESRNFWILVIYQVVLRAGWIFKTESVVMPHAADALDPTGLARGWLPLLNRFGQSVPPVLAARHVKNLPKKQRAFMTTTASMTICFLGLTSLWLIPGAAGHPLAAVAFLALYGLFFAAIGVNQLAYNTIQGKLIRPTRRGRLLMIADFVGATSAMVCAATLLMQWLHDDGADYAAIFGFTTCLFAVASVMSWFLKEQPDDHFEPYRGVTHVFHAAWQTLAQDANFRRLSIVSALFSTTLVLFPHYQALAREKLGLGTTWLVWWVVAQNGGTALFSLFTGPIADTYGNRLALRIVTLLIVAGPLAALAAIYWPEIGKAAFPLVFLFVGLTPVAQKTFNNYTLEITEPEHHPRYLSTLSLCMALPIFVSPLISPLINVVGFEKVYLGVVALLLLGWLLTFHLTEPRHGPRPIVLAEDSLD